MDYKKAIILVREQLKGKGFSARGSTFSRRVPGGNVLLVSIQKSVASSPTDVAVAVNIGVRSVRLDTALHNEMKDALDVWSAHWRKRLSEDGHEKWLNFSAEESTDSVAQTLLNAIDTVLPDLLAHSSDEALRDEWYSGSSPGLTNLKRLIYLAVLLHELGPNDKFAEVLQEIGTTFGGSTHEAIIRHELQYAGIASPFSDPDRRSDDPERG